LPLLYHVPSVWVFQWQNLNGMVCVSVCAWQNALYLAHLLIKSYRFIVNSPLGGRIWMLEQSRFVHIAFAQLCNQGHSKSQRPLGKERPRGPRCLSYDGSGSFEL
jgi:hypothetical protein